MKKIPLLLLLAYSIISCNRTTENATGTETSVSIEDAPVMKFDFIQHDFGQLKEGDVVKYAFKFKNVGKTALVIQSVNVGCGCTVASKPEKPIKPNESSEIAVQFNSTGKAGPQHKQVVVMSNSNPKEKILAFTAVVNAHE